MLDFRTEAEKESKMGYVARCETCGRKTIVGPHHGRYCPVCGKNTIANVSFEKMNGESASLHEVEVTYELTLRRSTRLFLDDDAYASLVEGDRSSFEKDMDTAVKEAQIGEYETDWTVYDVDTDKMAIRKKWLKTGFVTKPQ